MVRGERDRAYEIKEGGGGGRGAAGARAAEKIQNMTSSKVIFPVVCFPDASHPKTF